MDYNLYNMHSVKCSWQKISPVQYVVSLKPGAYINQIVYDLWQWTYNIP